MAFNDVQQNREEYAMERDSAGRFRSGREPQQSGRTTRQESCAPSAVGAGVASLISGAALGVVAMYLLDPKHGAQRRAMARNLAERALESSGDVTRSALHSASHYLGDAWHAARDKVADTASAAQDAMPNGKSMKNGAEKLMNGASSAASSVGDTASDWFESAKSYLPRRAKLEQHSDYAMNPGAVSATALSTMVVGASAMWLFDPDRGRARRAWIGQKITRAIHEIGDFASATGRHFRNKAKGYYHETRSTVQEVGEQVRESSVGQKIGM